MGVRTAKIADGIYWVGGSEQDGGLHCNPYLIVENDEAVLIDPGSVLDFEAVFENVCSLVPLENIKYCILHHQDPDFCSSVPLFEKKGANFKIVTHWRTQTLVKYYGVTSEYYIVNENDLKLTLKSGRTLGFVLTPYLHFPGAITTYDYKTKVLFSSDLFGAYSFEWNLYAQGDYIEKMKTFHEHYMPSNSILRPVMEVLLGMDIDIIAPQHGSVIHENVVQYIKVLRDLECGALLDPVKKDLGKSGGYMAVCTMVLKRLATVFSKEEIMEVIGDMDLTVDDDQNITDYNYTGSVLWNLIFDKVMARKGLQWIMIIEPLVSTLSKEYDIAMPNVFASNIKKVEEEAENLSQQNIMLEFANKRLESSLLESEYKLTRCPITGLYNFDFFKSYLANEINSILADDSAQNPGLIIISLDNIEKIEYYYGSDEVDQILKNAVFLLDSLKDGNELFFRLQGAGFACYLPQTNKESCIAFAEKIRNQFAASAKFIEKITVSVGAVSLEEIKDKSVFGNNPDMALYNIASMRVKLAINKGSNIVCSSSTLDEYQEEVGRILIVDTDEINIDILKTTLENMNYQVITADDGEEALKLAQQSPPLLIISEIMLPKMDGFLLREELLLLSSTKNVPFIVLSYLKNDESVLRASNLGIEHYLKKPFMLSEIIGIIRNKIKGDSYL